MTTSLVALALLSSSPAPAQMDTDPAPGQLAIMGKDNKVGDLCPLERTSVVADIAGFGARVTVTQTFVNPSRETIEAIYTFPLPNDAAVDRMQMRIGDRIVEGEIKRREEARLIYDAAKNAGQAAALLDQERPNIFTQSVANITPGAKVQIKISYVQILKFEKGEFEFVFPMVVGPRFLGNAPDPQNISPPITPKNTRTGANIDLTLNIDAGAPIQNYNSVLHQVSARKSGDSRMRVQLRRADEIPNKDFILRYSVATDTIQDGFIAHTGEKGGFFTLFLMPPAQPEPSQIAPREVIFVVDQSGSQSGFPIDKSKELTLQLIKSLHSADTFNVLGFSNNVNPLWKTARLNTPENVAAATKFVSALQANGGTQLRDAAVTALTMPEDHSRLRLVVFNTDGFVGDEAAILKSIHEHCNRSRMFTFGIGNSVNRYLLEEMAIAGRGDVEIVTLAEKADEAVSKFISRSENPVLTDVSVSIEGVEVETLLPQALPDVFSERPVVIMGRYSTPGTRSVTITGNLGGRPWSRNIEIDFPAQASAPALESMWARRKVDDLTRKAHLANILPEGDRATKDQVIDLALEFGIMTEYTSFVAVEKRVVNVGGKQRTVAVPIEMADGVSYEGIFGQPQGGGMYRGGPPAAMAMPATKSSGGAVGGGGFGGNALAAEVADAGSYRVDDSQMSPDARRKYRYETRVSKELREAKGNVEVQIYFTKLDQTILDKLVKLGLKVDFSDNGLKVAMGTCGQKVLEALAQVDEVHKIIKLK